ncbi:MAG TPA: alginate export family protein [Bdellovibrionales bacterium]|nr:alginate export family protein [Bdellovibrionales bacterium]
MSKLWTILFGLALVSSAQAQNADFKWNAELRTRYTNDMTKGWVKGATDADQNMFEGRTKLGVTAMKGDNLTGHVTLLHNNTWGQGSGGTITTLADHTAAGTHNLLSVQEAWGWWKANDMFSTKFGRAGFEYGDGTIFSLDDWQATPNSWEGIWTAWNFDFADLHAFGVKLFDPNSGVAGNSDPEIVGYGLVAHFKNLPEFLKHGFIHVVQVNADQVAPLGGATGANQLHTGLTVIGEAAAIDYRLTADIVTGKLKAGATDTTLSSNMIDLEVGYSFPEFMKGRVGLIAHMDTGDSNALDDKDETYQPLYYDTHKYAGLMDVVNWGNSTYYGLSFGLSPAEDLQAGIQYLMFTRTKDGAAASLNQTIGSAGSTAKEVGNELDLTLTKTYGDNFSIWGLYGMFMPGTYIKDNNGGTGDTHSRLQLQAKLTF